MQAVKMIKGQDALWAEKLPLQLKMDTAGSENETTNVPATMKTKETSLEPGTEYWLP